MYTNRAGCYIDISVRERRGWEFSRVENVQFSKVGDRTGAQVDLALCAPSVVTCLPPNARYRKLLEEFRK